MKEGILVLALLGMVMLSGCTELGIENPIATGNTLVVHNQYSWTDNEGVLHQPAMPFLSVVKVSDECADDKPCGINLLPEPLPFGEHYSIDGLADGKYYCQIGSGCWSSSEESGYVTLSGGNTTDWYVR